MKEVGTRIIPSSVAGEYIGERVTVRGGVKDFHWLQEEPGRPFILWFSDGFIVIIEEEDAVKNFDAVNTSIVLRNTYVNESVCVTGTIWENFGGISSITVTHPDQLIVETSGTEVTVRCISHVR